MANLTNGSITSHYLVGLFIVLVDMDGNQLAIDRWIGYSFVVDWLLSGMSCSTWLAPKGWGLSGGKYCPPACD